MSEDRIVETLITLFFLVIVFLSVKGIVTIYLKQKIRKIEKKLLMLSNTHPSSYVVHKIRMLVFDSWELVALYESMGCLRFKLYNTSYKKLQVEKLYEDACYIYKMRYQQMSI
jgi:hypothetical protein